MGKSTCLRLWAITVTGEKAVFTATPRTGQEFEHGGKKWVLVIGPVEGNTQDEHANQHIGLKCLSRNVSKSAAREAAAVGLCCDVNFLEECYFKKIDTSWERWIDYCFKERCGTVGAALKSAHEKILSEGRIPNKRLIQEVLAQDHDFEYYCKRLKPALNEYIGLSCMSDERGLRKDKIDLEQNKMAFVQSFNIFQKQLVKTFERDDVFTTWETQMWSNLHVEEKRLFCEILALLPICTKRSPVVPDRLPGLFIWGPPNTGKSAFFDNGIFLRKFPQDSQGVSRFKLELTNAGILFDDIPEDFLDRPDISGTLRQMCLGGSANIKTFGSTETVVGYVVVTSNNKPRFLEVTKPPEVEGSDEQWERNQAAWRRRFITLKFDDFIDNDPIGITWTDPNFRSYAAQLIVLIGQLLAGRKSELYEQFVQPIEELLKTDYHLESVEDWDEDIIYDKELEPNWDKKTKTVNEALMGKPTGGSKNPFMASDPAECYQACRHGRYINCQQCGVVNPFLTGKIR